MSKFFWPFVANVALFAAIACFYPFLVIYYRQQGLSGAEIGLLSGLTPLLTLLGAPLWTNLADVTRRHRLIMSLLIVVTAATLAALPALHAFVPVLLLIIVLSACFSPITALLDSATLAMLGHRRELYGRVRVGGTLGYVAMGALVGALVQRTSLQFSFWTGAAPLLVLLVSAQRLSFGAAPPPAQPGVGAGPAAAATGGVRTLLADRRWWPFLVLVFAAGLSLTLTTTYILAYMQELGADAAGMGLALTMGAVMEIPMMLIGHRLLARYPSYSLFMLAIVLTGLRLLLYVVTRSPTAVIWLQLANGITYPLAWLSGVTYAHDHAPPGLSATAQGLFGAIFSGFGAAVGNFVGGPLFGRFGGHVTYLIFGSTILAIAAGMWLVQRLTTPKTVDQSPRHPLPDAGRGPGG